MGMFDIGGSLPAIPATHRQTRPLSRYNKDKQQREHPQQNPPAPQPDAEPEDGLPHIDEYA